MIGKLLLLSLIFLNCVNLDVTKPQQDFNFSKISDLNQIKGIYRNPGDPKGFLSQVLWNNANITDNLGRKVLHNEIEFIQVSSKDNFVTVNAIKDNCIIYTKKYELNKDFKIIDGRIIIKDESHPLTRGDGDVVLGPSSEKIELGLDTEGHGKFKSKINVVGLVYMMIPLIVSEDITIRFKKMDNNRLYEECKE
jgi:hypothetical protein